MDGESTLDVVEQSEVLSALLDRDDILLLARVPRLKSCDRHTHETSWESLVGPDFSVDLDDSLLNNSSNLPSGQSVL